MQLTKAPVLCNSPKPPCYATHQSPRAMQLFFCHYCYHSHRCTIAPVLHNSFFDTCPSTCFLSVCYQCQGTFPLHTHTHTHTHLHTHLHLHPQVHHTHLLCTLPPATCPPSTPWLCLRYSLGRASMPSRCVCVCACVCVCVCVYQACVCVCLCTWYVCACVCVRVIAPGIFPKKLAACV